MAQQRFFAALLTAAALTACSAQDTVNYTAPEQGDPEFFKVRDSMADEVYVTDDSTKREWFDDIRRVYIAPLNLSQMQIIQPHGVDDEEQWEVDDIEKSVVVKTFLNEFTVALEADQAFHVVTNREDAQAVLAARVIAVHPYRSRAEAAAEGGRGKGAVTISIALVDPSDGTAVIRAIDTKSTDDVSALDTIHEERDAIDALFESWGHQARRSLLFLQGRLDAVPTPILLKRQPRAELL